MDIYAKATELDDLLGDDSRKATRLRLLVAFAKDAQADALREAAEEGSWPDQYYVDWLRDRASCLAEGGE
jgi:hypothetical protein